MQYNLFDTDTLKKSEEEIDLYEVAEVKAIYTSNVKPSERTKVCSSKEANKIFHKYWNYQTIELHEEVKILLLNRANKAIGLKNHTSGGGAGCIMDVKQILQIALITNSQSIVICHNHPSGNIYPSESDISITEKIKKVCEALDISLLDHLIITPEKERYYSFADEGRL